MKIESFSGEYRWLSNFWPCKVFLEDLEFRSVEAAYVASKTLDENIREQVQELKTSGECKAFGKTIPLRKDWKEVRLKVMENLLRQKFQKDSELGQKLISTKNIELIEGNYWNDTFWGVCKGKGKNNLGKLLMKIRRELSGDLEITFEKRIKKC
jgi:ribA/ribD-fused uncharacterized protein